MPDTPHASSIESLVGNVVVLDTQGPLLYIGTLLAVGPQFWILQDADVHDRNDSRSTKELYLVETRQLGIRPNRHRVHVASSIIASVSLLADIIG